MPKAQERTLSVVVPVFNEGAGLRAFHASLVTVLDSVVKGEYEVVYCNDGSTDDTFTILEQLAAKSPAVR
ncbi:MAG TPA: glycosyltransferase, partial [Candidatus Saccharimonadales bacterium]